MKTLILSILLLLVSSVAWGEAGCKTVVHADHDEAICTGDEKPVSEQNTQVQGKSEPALSAPQITKPLQQAEPVNSYTTSSVPAENQTAETPTPVQNAAPAARGTSETAAEHLARRKALAIQNTQKIKGNTAPAPAAQ